LNLWSNGEGKLRSILIVTHNIEEAVQMADRVVVLGSHPGHVIANVDVNLPRPRDKHAPEFEDMVDKLYSILTGRGNETMSKSPRTPNPLSGVKQMAAESPTNRMLPDATPGGLAGLLEIVAGYPDGIDLAELASALSFEVDDLFPLLDAGTLLGMLDVNRGHVTVTEVGHRWNDADILNSKVVFADIAMSHVPLVRAIDRALRQSRNGSLHGDLIVDLLRNKEPEDVARKQFHIAIEWGRYGELFDYDADDDILTLDEAAL
ncbi:AAA-associated domain-containing protein, partial [Bifidobacterium aquikefiri]